MTHCTYCPHDPEQHEPPGGCGHGVCPECGREREAREAARAAVRGVHYPQCNSRCEGDMHFLLADTAVLG